MNFTSFSAGIVVAIGSALALSGTAQAASLINFDTTVSYPGQPKTCTINTKCDIKLDSVMVDGKTILANELYKVTGAALIANTLRKPDAPGANLAQTNANNTGALSSDTGDLANGIKMEDLAVETGANKDKFNTSVVEQTIVKTLGGSKPFNMNNILDTEDDGSFILDLVFDAGKAFNTLLLWERGMNSDIEVQAITAVAGNQATGFGETQKVLRSEWTSAGYSIDTTEITGAQPVGARGVQFSSDVLGVRLISKSSSKSSFNGPDFKLAATKVPEPATVASLGLVAGLAALSRRKRQAV